VGEPRWVLDVGSADGPSVGWLRGHGKQVALDIDVRGLEPGGVCGSALALPFADGVFDLVAAFDVVEHCEPEAAAMAELTRVLAPGGRLLISVPAYQWAWSRFDELSGHHRRYTRMQAMRAVEAAGLRVSRATYVFMAVFPIFLLDRMRSQLRAWFTRRGVGRPGPEDATLPVVSGPIERALIALSDVDARLLRRHNLPFGSSVVLAATKDPVGGHS
jgi:SAM-dependent methyltransferase